MAGAPIGIDVEQTVRRRGAFVSLHERDFAVFLSSALVSNIGTWMQSITVPFVIDELTHSTTAVGVGAFLTYFPAVLSLPVAGSFSDRFPRRTVLLIAQVVPMVMAFALAALWVTDLATFATIIPCVVIGAIANGFAMASWTAFVPQLVSRENMVNAIRLNSMQFTIARVFGPVLAGLVLSTLGAGAAFLANGLSFVVVIVGLLAIPKRPAADDYQAGGMFAHFGEGLAYVRAHRVLRVPTIVTLLFVVLGFSIMQLMEPFVKHVLRAGAAEYGVLLGAAGVGALLGMIVIVFREHISRGRTACLALGAFVVTQIAFGAVPGLEVAFVGLGIMGACQMLVQVSLQTAVQANVVESYRGRVMSVYISGFFGGTPLGALLLGVAGGLFGLQAAFIGSAVALGLFTLVYVGVGNGFLRFLDEPHQRVEPRLTDAPVVDPAEI